MSIQLGDRVFLITDPRHIGYITKMHPEDSTCRIFWPKTQASSHRVPLADVRKAHSAIGFDD